MNNAAYNNTNNNTHNHTDNHTMLHWFYSFTAKVRLTGTAQRLWHCLYYRMDGTAAGRSVKLPAPRWKLNWASAAKHCSGPVFLWLRQGSFAVKCAAKACIICC